MENMYIKVKEESEIASNTIKIEPGFHMTFEDGIKEEHVSNEDTKFKANFQVEKDLPQEALDRRREIRRFCSPSLCLLTFDQSYETFCNCPTRPWPRPNYSLIHVSQSQSDTWTSNRSMSNSRRSLFEAVPIAPFKLRITKRKDSTNEAMKYKCD